jgi:hypothetical protein
MGGSSPGPRTPERPTSGREEPPIVASERRLTLDRLGSVCVTGGIYGLVGC